MHDSNSPISLIVELCASGLIIAAILVFAIWATGARDKPRKKG